MLHLATFASSDLKRSLRRLVRQAAEFDAIATINDFSEDDLKEYSNLMDIIAAHPRGYGLWCWKPFVIWRALSRLSMGDRLLYVDVGCELNAAGVAKLNEYIEILDQTVGILPFRAVPPPDDILEKSYSYDGLLECEWSKKELFEFFGVLDNPDVTLSPQFGAGIVFFKKTEFTMSFVNQWMDIMENHLDLYDDLTYKGSQSSLFKQSRHDQSVFSLLCKVNGLSTYRSAYEYFHPRIEDFWRGIPIGDWDRLSNYPIHAKRNKDYGLFGNIRRLNFPFARLYLKALLARRGTPFQ